jgi:hypothetical protein
MQKTISHQKHLMHILKNYLNSLGKKVYNFSYVVDENTLYFLKGNDQISEVDIEFLIDKLLEQDVLEFEDLQKLFDPTNYLVSPFNSTERFINGEYFLTNHQESIKNELIKRNTNDNENLFSIQGAAGTGKTLLVYDLAKEYLNNNKKVAIIHCGILNEGHSRLINNYSWDIMPAKHYKRTIEGYYDLIIIDECQRIYKNQLTNIVEHIINSNSTCIFSYDPNQCLHRDEIIRNIPGYLDTTVHRKFKLTEKIRTNSELTSFIKNLFDLSKANPQQEYSNIEIQYFSDIQSAKGYIRSLRERDWISIDYTVSNFTWSSLDDIRINSGKNAHTVIGQEYDNVLVVIGNSFSYNDKGQLIGDRTSYYHPTKMLFQILTRTRKKLCLVIVNNEELLKKCIEILK